MTLAVEVNNVTKRFGDAQALDGLSFGVNESEIFGLIGPNGAGKTTSLRIVSTLILPTSGHVTIFGHDVAREASEVRRLISYLPEEAGAYRNLSGFEYLRFMGRFSSRSKAELNAMVNDAATISGLGERLRDKVKVYSKGMKRRLLVARALMTKPRLCVLDEPTSGLDVLHSFHVRNIIKEYAEKQGVTVLLSSHNMLEVEYLCERVALVNRGKIVAEGAPNELKLKFRVSNLEEVFAEVAGLA